MTFSQQLVRQFAVSLVLLVTPFVIFLQHHGYSYVRLEIVLCYLIFTVIALLLGVAGAISPVVSTGIVAALITAFVDIQYDHVSHLALFGVFLASLPLMWVIRTHASTVLFLMVATMLVSTLLLPKERPTAPSTLERGADLPLTIHLLLDEHIGIEGLPVLLKSRGVDTELRSFFDRNKFVLFGRAYSEYFNSVRSISHLLNLAPGRHNPELYTRGTNGFTWDLKRNGYFERAVQRGYALHIYQPDYMNLCPPSNIRVACHTYSATGIRDVEGLLLPVTEKAVVIGSVYLSRSNLYSELRSFYRRVRRKAVTIGISLPVWEWERDRFGPVPSMANIDRLTSDVATARRGDFFFAHLLIPHYPYVYQADCALQSVDQWLPRETTDAPQGMTNTEDSRAIRYSLYGQQLGCLYQKIGALLDAIPDALLGDATLIIQGDHGSRITLVDPSEVDATRLSSSDYIDSYSTLFAVRGPGLKPGYDSRVVSIACLLRTLSENDHLSFDGLETCNGTPAVFLQGIDERMITTRFPQYPFAQN